MDRLPAVMRAPTPVGLLMVTVLVASAALGCDDDAKGAAEPAPEGRVNAVLQTKKAPTFADLCDVAPDKAAPKTFSFPQLAAAAGASAGTFRWVNVWATWCKPCIEELPMLSRTLTGWQKQGQKVELTLLSVDADAVAAAKFIADHPGTPPTLQIADPSTATSWLSSMGLATGSAIPVHMIVDAQNNLVCARSGSISEEDVERFHRAMFP